jgi:hypothetical protein
MDSKTMLVHDYYPNRYSATTEFFFPCHDMPSTVKETLHPWLQQMVGFEPKLAKDILLNRWADISIESLVHLRDLFLGDFFPQSIFTHENDAWLGLARPTRVLPNSGDIILLPPPPDATKVEQGLTKCPFANDPGLFSFVNHFGSFREEIPPSSGSFLIPDPWETLFDCWGQNDDGRYGEWYAEWSDALVVYGAISGDMVLLHPSGKLGWLGFAEGEIWHLADNFDAFVRRYTIYRRKARGSLDGDILEEE